MDLRIAFADSRPSGAPQETAGIRQSKEQPTGTEDGASSPGAGALQRGHRCTQRDPILRARPTGGGRAERRDAGVAFAIRNDIAGRLPCLTQGIKDRLMSLRQPLRAVGEFATIINAYAPPMISHVAARDKFYGDLHALLATVPKADKMVARGDFNARVGTDQTAWRGVLGPHGLRGSKDNGLLLLRTCAEHRLILTNTFVCLPSEIATEHEAEDVQGRHPVGAAVRRGVMDSVPKAGSRMNNFYLSCLRRILRSSRQDRIPDTDVLERTGIPNIYTMLRQMQLRWSGHLVRMGDEQPRKRLFYGEVATGSRRQGGKIRRNRDTLKSSLKCLQGNPTTWEDAACDRPTWRRTVKTGAAIYEVNRIAAAKVKREARKSQLRPVRNSDAQPHPTSPRCQRTFWARIGLVGLFRINCASRTAPNIVPSPASFLSSPPPNNSDNSSVPPLPNSSFSSSSSSSSSTSSSSSASSSSSSHNTAGSKQ
nr:unnamed protein product [Spirometra erinaceieuropaei]